jgi:hypothetical protein
MQATQHDVEQSHRATLDIAYSFIIVDLSRFDD